MSKDDWIPVNGTPPKDGQKCLVTIRTIGGRDRFVDIGTYSTNLYDVNMYDFCNKRGVPGWYWYSSEWGYCKMQNVVAWKPLGEPYMGD